MNQDGLYSLPEQLGLKLLEPLRELFKDEVRELGVALGLPHNMVYRHPFPGPGLGVRILGEVKKEYADLLRRADAIFLEEIRKLVSWSSEQPEGPFAGGGALWSFECVGHPAVTDSAVRCLDWGGTCVQVGVPAPGVTYAVPITHLTQVDRGTLAIVSGQIAKENHDAMKVRTPTFLNIPTVVPMVRGAALADVPLIQGSIDPCYSCTDR